MSKLFGLIFISCVAGIYGGELCSSPSVKASSYTPSDASTLTHMAYIAEWTLTCSNSVGKEGLSLYANVQGAIVPVVRSQSDANKYQISWAQETKMIKSSAADFTVDLYDEEGYAALKRVQGRGEDISAVKPLASIVVNYPGAFKGHYINSELLASIVAALVFYFAYASKSALMA